MYYKIIVILNLFIALSFASDCSVIQDILTQNSLEITWSPSNSTGCCSYEGINCVNDRIIQINFSNKGYNGKIESLMPLTSLQYININNCLFTGSIPSSIKNISNLQFFYAQGNKISGNIPNELAISTLQFIDLSGNNLEGPIPSSIGNIINLQHINLSNNNFQGSIPSSFHSLKNIQVFRVSGNSKLCGEIPIFSNTLKDCNFGSTSLCIKDSRTHCTDGIKTCDTVNCNNEINITDNKISSNSTNSDSNNSEEIVTPNNFNIRHWISIGFVGLLVLCLVILSLICWERRKKNKVVIDKPIPSHSNDEIFTTGYDDPDSSIQIHSLSRPEVQSQNMTSILDSDIYNTQTNSYDESSQYETVSGRSSNYEYINRNSVNSQRSPIINPVSNINQNSIYTNNSLNRNQTHQINMNMFNSPVDSNEQDISDVIVSNNAININDNIHAINANSRRMSNLSSYTKSQSSPNLVRLNRYSVVNQNPSVVGNGKRIITSYNGSIGNLSESPKLVSSSITNSPRHNSIPYPVSVLPYTVKSSNVNTFPRKSIDAKRKLSTGNEDNVHKYNTINVGNNRRSIQYPIEKNSTKGTNHSETVSSNSAHSSTPIMSKCKNRNSLPPMNSKKSSVLAKFSSQNNMNISSVSSNLNENMQSNIKKSTNPTNATINTIEEIEKKISNEALPEIGKDSQNQINMSKIPSDLSTSSLKNTTTNIENDTYIVYNNEIPHINSENISTPLENIENIEEEIYIDDGDFSQAKLESINDDEDNKEYHQMMLEKNDNYPEYNDMHENFNESIEEQQPPDYEEVFSEMYTPYIDTPNDEAIRMQLEMRRIEERQIRMEYLQRQIDNPEISNAQRQKYIDALDRLMLE